MKISRAITAFTKLNLKVEPPNAVSHKWIVFKKDNSDRLEFSESYKGSGEVSYFTARHPDTDARIDYFCDSYFDTIKSACQFLTSK